MMSRRMSALLLAQFTAAQCYREGVGVEEEDLHAGAVPVAALMPRNRRSENCGPNTLEKVSRTFTFEVEP